MSHAFDQDTSAPSRRPLVAGRSRFPPGIHNARAQLEQLKEVAGDQRQRDYRRLVTVPPRVAFVVSIAGASAVTVTVGLLTGRQGKIDAHVQATSSTTLLCSVALESLGRCAHRIRADEQAGSRVFSRRIGRQRSRRAPSYVDDGYFRARDHAPAKSKTPPRTCRQQLWEKKRK